MRATSTAKPKTCEKDKCRMFVTNASSDELLTKTLARRIFIYALALRHLSFLHQNHLKRMDVLLRSVSSLHLKRLLCISLLTMRQGKQTYPPQTTAIDSVAQLAKHRAVAERLVSDASSTRSATSDAISLP